MLEKLGIFPEAASEFADQVDYLYFFLIGVTIFFVTVIVAALAYLSVRYRHRRSPVPTPVHGSILLELTWSGIPLVIALFIFGWGAKLYIEHQDMPPDGIEISVTGKQWMWKLQHPSGQREINALHVPVGVPILLTMTSEDVIHSFYVPAFRFKRDVVPGVYTRAHFTADKTGSFHLFCAEYCGTDHSVMIGKVVVMEPSEYEAWLSGQPAGETPVQAGERLFTDLRCNTCHAAGSDQKGPDLAGVFGSKRLLVGGGEAIADEEYIRESILRPARKVVFGYEPLMPTYQGQVNETQILSLMAYLKTLGGAAEGANP